MTGRRTRFGWRVIVVVTALIAAFSLDQLTKAWALSALADGTVVPLVPTVRLELFFNPGVAFGIGAEFGAPLVIGIMVLVSALLGWIGVRLVKRDDIAGTVFLALTAGGGIGNIWDRISRAENGPLTGEVVDFIAVDWFAIFNVADIFTTCGIALWVIASAMHERRSTVRERDQLAG